MRTFHSISNLTISLLSQVVNIFLQFILRTFFIQVFSAEYLGLNGLFSNILSFLSFAELGFGSAITFSLYKPLAEDNRREISGIMNFFSRVYKVIAIVIFTGGLLLNPFLDHLIKEVPDIPHLHLIFFLSVLNSAVSYLFIYKSTLLIADQRKDLVESNNLIFKIIQLIVQIFVILYAKNYILFLVISILATILSNLSVNRIAARRYPYLKKSRSQCISDSSLVEIKKNVKATILHKIGSIAIFSTDNILLSRLYGLTIVGLYSNYNLIISTLTNFIGQIQSSIIASVGNLGVTATNEDKEKTFSTYFLINYWIYSATTICLICLFNKFINLWLGNDFTMSIYVVIVISVNYFVTGVRSAAATFDNAFGLFWKTRKLPIVESILNLVLSVILSYISGFIGVFLGTLISSVLTGLWYEPSVLYKFGFKISHVSTYFYRLFRFMLFTFLVCTISYIFVGFVPVTNFYEFFIVAFILFVIVNLLHLLFFFRLKEFREVCLILGRIKTILQRR